MFIAMGALFAQRTLYLKNWQVLLGFLLSAGLLFAECFALKDNGFMHDLTSMYAMLLPCMFFLFLGLFRIHLPQSKVYKTLRVLSLLIYVMHIMFVNLLLRVWPLMNSLAVYGLVMLLTLIMSCIIPHMSMVLSFKASLCLNRRNIMLRIQQIKLTLSESLDRGCLDKIINKLHISVKTCYHGESIGRVWMLAGRRMCILHIALIAE